MSDRISVLISAYNKHDITVAHVRECMNSTRVPDEIIVVNDGGTPDLRDKLITLPKKTKVIYARINEDIKWNYTGARNLGMFISTGDFISLEDNDHIPQKTYYQDCLDAFKENPKLQRLLSHKRYVITEEDIVTKPTEDWKIISKRPYHRDVAFNRREVFLILKGYDERFAGEYGWCSTDLNRRIFRENIVCGHAGYQWVVYSEKTRGLSSRNWRMSRIQKENQSPTGILNFRYTYEQLS
tara:strand:+ start:3230 stop:3949 length:720 start_codon:yes stop_codon:yes gene_type:complete